MFEAKKAPQTLLQRLQMSLSQCVQFFGCFIDDVLILCLVIQHWTQRCEFAVAVNARHFSSVRRCCVNDIKTSCWCDDFNSLLLSLTWP